MVLVPVFIHLLGRWTWWAPRWLVRTRRPAAEEPQETTDLDREKVSTSVNDGD
jgi:RND superfamily putative drug exporter